MIAGLSLVYSILFTWVIKWIVMLTSENIGIIYKLLRSKQKSFMLKSASFIHLKKLTTEV